MRLIQRLKIWLQAARAPFLTATFIPVILGTGVAWYQTNAFRLSYFLLALAGVSFLHTGTNLMNDYFDHRSGNDVVNKNYTKFNGGSRVIQDGLITPRGVLLFALSCFIAGSLLGLWLNYQMKTNVILFLGIIGVFCGFFYTAAPVKIGYTGLGELIVGLCFGPLVVLGAHYVQSGMLSWVAFWASIPVGILIGLVLYINEFPDYEADKSVEKRTLVVRLGKSAAIKVYQALLLSTYCFVVIGVIGKILPVFTLVMLVTLPLSFKTLRVSGKNYDKVTELLPANAATIGLHSLSGVLLTIGFVLGKIF